MMNNWTADFPILAADENGNRLVYLDSAATTQHPKQVLDAVVNYYNKDNANPHRGVYELAMRATDAHEGARHTVAEFFNAEDDEIVFTQNTTEALNLVALQWSPMCWACAPPWRKSSSAPTPWALWWCWTAPRVHPTPP